MFAFGNKEHADERKSEARFYQVKSRHMNEVCEDIYAP